ncbi:melanoma-associated antigen 10-like [Dugong dugon]
MSHTRAPKRRRYTVEQDLQNEMEAQGSQVPASEEEEKSLPSSSSFNFPFLPGSSSSSSSPLIRGTVEEVSAVGTLSTSQSSQKTTSFSSDDGSITHEGEGPSTRPGQPDIESLLRDTVDYKVADLVEFLLRKYQTKEPVTKAEMLTVIRQYEDHFLVIFKKACECIELVFGINMKEEDPTGNSYVFYNTLDLTYDGIPSNDQGMPKTGLLVLALSMIFMEGNCATEEKLWEMLNTTGVYAGREHVIYGEPRQFITRDLVQEEYLEYRQVPNSDPARYEFLWGPRAHAETSKMKVLQFLAKVSGSIPSAFPSWYEDALRDDEERAKARVSPMDTTTVMASSSSSAAPSSFSCPQ